MGVGVEWTWDTEILFSSSVCTEEVQEVRRTGSGGARTWLCPWHQHLGAALLSFPLIPLVPRMLGGTTVEPSQGSQLCLRTSCPHGGEGVPDLCHFHSTQVPKHFVVPLRRTAPGEVKAGRHEMCLLPRRHSRGKKERTCPNNPERAPGPRFLVP